MTLTTRMATGAGRVLERRFSRRSLLGRTAVVGAAVSVGGLDFVLRPQGAYAAVCGPGASCGEGWTAMCCTINNGVNQCPPGSFAGGWWKADGASLCGGKARYYIDCQGECTNCGCNGSSFCTEGCWNCTRHCASGTCDERRVCWNVFRYGQCHQEIGCSGPVLCRQISCVPPWQFEACTTDAATDDNTTDHSAPCLSSWSTIQARYAALGGPGSSLGATVNAEQAVPGGTAQYCTSGRIYQASGSSTAYWMSGVIAGSYDGSGGPNALGLPVSDTTTTAEKDATFTDFAGNASIYVGPTGRQLVRGAVRTLWVQLGRERSVGYPAGAQVTDGSTTAQRFQTGELVVRSSGSYSITGAVFTVWSQVGQPALGWPTANRVSGSSTFSQTFDNGVVIASSATGTHAVYGDVYAKYVSAGGSGGSFGLPIGDLQHDFQVSYQQFQGGRITA